MRLISWMLVGSCMLPLVVVAQIPARPGQVYRNEISIVSDNDNYTLEGRDGYYTNGFFIKWSHAPDISRKRIGKIPGVVKVVNGWEAGQAIYNPISYNRPFPETQDRPFAAYLAVNFDQQIFRKTKTGKTSVLMWGAGLGTIGENAYGRQVQRWYHRVIGIYDVKGWPSQVNDEWSLNFKGSWYVSPFASRANPPAARRFEALGFLRANAGNALTNASGGIVVRAGRMESLFNSSHFRAQIGSAKAPLHIHRSEAYFFYEPAVTFQAYNAVLQGGMFLQNKGPVTAKPERWVFSQQLGFRFAKNRFTGALVDVHRTREAKSQVRNEHFVSLQFAYRFGRQH